MTNEIIASVFKDLGISSDLHKGFSTGIEWYTASSTEVFTISSPIDGSLIGSVEAADDSDFQKIIIKAKEAYPVWSAIPSPKRGEIIRQYG